MKPHLHNAWLWSSGWPDITSLDQTMQFFIMMNDTMSRNVGNESIKNRL